MAEKTRYSDAELEEFRAISKDDSCQPESKGFLDRIKDLFKSVA